MTFKVEIRYENDEVGDIYVNDTYVYTMTHDELGWDGMGALLRVMTNTASVVGGSLREVYLEDGNTVQNSEWVAPL